MKLGLTCSHAQPMRYKTSIWNFNFSSLCFTFTAMMAKRRPSLSEASFFYDNAKLVSKNESNKHKRRLSTWCEAANTYRNNAKISFARTIFQFLEGRRWWKRLNPKLPSLFTVMLKTEELKGLVPQKGYRNY